MTNETDRTCDRTCIIENEVFYDLLVSKVSDESLDKLDKKTARVRNVLLGGAAAGVGVLVFAFQIAIGQMEERIKEAVKNAGQIIEEKEQVILHNAENVAREIARKTADEVAKTTTQEQAANIVDESIEKVETAWERVLLYSELKSFSAKLELDDGFTEVEALNVLDTLKVMKESNFYQDDPNFPKLLEEAIGIFQSADRDDLVQELEPMFEDIILSEEGIIITMIEALGNTLVGSVAPPSVTRLGNAAEKWKKTYDRFEHYSRSPRSKNPTIQALLAIYVPLLSFVSSDKPEVVEAELLELSNLDDHQKEIVETILFRFISEMWVKDSTGESRRVKKRTLEFLEHYKNIDATGTLMNAYEMRVLGE